MKTQKWIVAGLGFILVGLALAKTNSLPVPSPDAVSKLSPLEAMELANAWGRSGAKVQSFVTPQALQFKFDNGLSASVKLPTDTMVIAFAPYLNHTHPCKTHYMSSCQGELIGQFVKVAVKTIEGKSVFKGTVQTLENGFFELWLPREKNLEIKVEMQTKKALTLISTFQTSDTCITTLQLH